MSTPKAYPAERDYFEATAEGTCPHEPRKLFDVVCVVGSVYSGDSDLTPREAAFLMIARHGADGEFTFPNEDGTLNIVGVVTHNPDA